MTGRPDAPYGAGRSAGLNVCFRPIADIQRLGPVRPWDRGMEQKHLREAWLLMDLNQINRAVLVVEDEPFIRMIAADAFEQAGVAYFEAGDANEAFDQLRLHSEICVLFTDINMPGSMDGMALAAAVHEQHPEIELIVTSGRRVYSDDELPDSGTFMPKPYLSDRLVEVVNAKLAAFARRTDAGR